MNLTRRDVILSAAATVAASAMPPRERYQLGCMTQILRSAPVDEALERIRRAGYRYIRPGRLQGGESTITPEMTPAQRTEIKRKFREAGLTPCMSLGGFSAELTRPGGLEKYMAELD